MKEQISELVATVHDRPGMVVLVTAGAGTQALAWLLGVGGASRTLLEARVPYAASAFDDFLGLTPGQYAAPPTAARLAGRALQRAHQLEDHASPLVGLACSATIVTDRPKRGQHRAHVVAWTATGVRRYSLVLEKGARDRTGEETLVSHLILNTLAETLDVPARLDLPLGQRDKLSQARHDFAAAMGRVVGGARSHFAITPTGQVAHTYQPKAVLSGAFNPLHEGHLRLAATAAELLQAPVTFELAVVNAGKATLQQNEALRRLTQFAGAHAVIASAAPRFDQKAELFPNTVFVVGYDTARRVLEERFYDNSHEQLLAALRRIRTAGCRFLVAGRADAEGRFHPADELAPPAGYSDLFEPVPADRFRLDISSTELRRRAAAD
ncbi:MAG: hypothetical protein R3300_06940 [Candidatus Promineifilaceae bacterium]|nr:hypothetical protein [Candidatus Promineifilaceae bacterium]